MKKTQCVNHPLSVLLDGCVQSSISHLLTPSRCSKLHAIRCNLGPRRRARRLRAVVEPDRHQLTGFFEIIVTGEEVERGKPAPDIYLCAAQKLGIPADKCLVVEDALPGVAAAKAAKMRVAAIPDHRFVDPREYEKRADYVLSSLKELLALVRKLGVAE